MDHARRPLVLSGLYRIFGAEPFAPTALEGVHLGVSVGHHFTCQTGTGGFVGSGAVENIFLGLGVVADPLGVGFGIGVPRALNFEFR